MRRASQARVTIVAAPRRHTVVEGGAGDDRVADQEDVGLRVRERAKAVVVLLAGRVPQAQIDGLAVHHHVGLGRFVRARAGAARQPRHAVAEACGGLRCGDGGGVGYRVVVEHGGDVLAREGVRGVRDEQACLSDGAIANNDTLRVMAVLVSGPVRAGRKTCNAARRSVSRPDPTAHDDDHTRQRATVDGADRAEVAP